MKPKDDYWSKCGLPHDIARYPASIKDCWFIFEAWTQEEQLLDTLINFIV
jgi:hypothetical protein